MSSSEESNQLNNEERLKGIAYQFLKLYERWSEDRQVFNKNMVKQEEVLKLFTSQLNNLEKLEPQIRKELINSIQNATKSASQEIGKTIGESVTFEMDQACLELKKRINQANEMLEKHQENEKNSLLITIALMVGTAIVSSLLIVWLLMPKPTLPLTDDQLTTYYNGEFYNEFWPKLSKKEQQHLTALASKPDNTENNNGNVTDTDSSNSDNQ
jgi:hypothetical protein